MHLLFRDGRPLTCPLEIPADATGAGQLAELYAFPSEGVHVRAMMNTSIDGAAAGADGTSGSLRNPTDSFAFGVLRALADVVLVGARTVRVEDYRRPRGRKDLLEPSRRPGGRARPAVAIMSRGGDLPDSIEADWPTFLLVPADAREQALRRSGFPDEQVLVADGPRETVGRLADLGFRGIQVEGGPSRLAELTTAGAVDELCLSVSHRTVAGPSPRALDGPAHEQHWHLQSMVVGEHATLTRYLRG